MKKNNEKFWHWRGRTSQNKGIQQIDNILFSINLDINMVINQKFFYSDNSDLQIYKHKTLKYIKATKKEKQELKKYLKEKKISIKYFEKFEGYISLFICEGYKENIDYLVKGIYIQFINELYKKKKFVFFFIQQKYDIEIMLIILKHYLDDFIVIVDEMFLHNLYIENLKFFKKLNFYYIYNIMIDVTSYDIIMYFEKCSNLIDYANNLSLIELKKNYIYVETKQNLNLEMLDNYILYEKEWNIFPDNKKQYFLNFKGLIFLVEIEIIINNEKIRRFVIFFYNINEEKLIFFSLFDYDRIALTLNIINFLFIESNFSLSHINKKLHLFKDMISKQLIFIKNDYIFNKDDNVDINENIQLMKFDNIENLIFYLEYYKLFFPN